jgi:hypothetical protein
MAHRTQIEIPIASRAIHPTKSRNPPTPVARSDRDTQAGRRPVSQVPSNSLGHRARRKHSPVGIDLVVSAEVAQTRNLAVQIDCVALPLTYLLGEHE